MLNLLLTTSSTDAMSALEQTGNNFFSDARIILVTAVAAAILFVAFRLILGNKETKRSAKEDLPSILLGAILVAGCVSIAAWVVGNIAF